MESLAKRLKLKLYRTCVSENLNVDKVRRAVPNVAHGDRTCAACSSPTSNRSSPASNQSTACRRWQVFEYLGEQYVNGPSEPELPAPSQTPAAATSAASPPAPLTAPASKTSEESKDPAPSPAPAAGLHPFPALLAPPCLLPIPPISAPEHALQLPGCRVPLRNGIGRELRAWLAVRVGLPCLPSVGIGEDADKEFGEPGEPGWPRPGTAAQQCMLSSSFYFQAHSVLCCVCCRVNTCVPRGACWRCVSQRLQLLAAPPTSVAPALLR